MKKLTLVRFVNGPRVTLGVLKLDSKNSLYTLEDPWKNNEKNVSCIPLGHYICDHWRSAKFGETYKVMEVPDRTDILFHIGNTTLDTQGCILLGMDIGFVNGPAITQSKIAFGKFKMFMEDVPRFILEIVSI
jgi:hypothetical protein